MIDSGSKFKSKLVYDLYIVCTQTRVLILSDLKGSRPVNMLEMLILLDKWVFINIVYRRWICDSVI
jgi:hypothetical protein